jgi:hypothetical protein
MNRILNCKPSRDTHRDWTFAHARSAGVLTARAALPRTVDLRAPWWKVGDQLATGSCVGWALADSVLRWHFTGAGRLDQKELLSPRFIWMAAKETDQFETQPTTFIETEGTSLKAALDIARKFGAVTDDVLPFRSGKLYQDEAPTFYAVAAKLKIASYFNLGKNPEQWRTWLATAGPILTRLEVDDTWDNALKTKGKLDIYHPATVRGGHAVSLVGYTESGFIVRNSWGTSAWGDKGFGYASNAYAKEAFDEAYGVTL